MSIASEITRINDNISAAYTACDNKGATMPQTQNSANLADTVASIPSSSSPTLITKQITANGTYTAADDSADGYSSVEVDVQPVEPAPQYLTFIDYDGTILYSYNESETRALIELPPLPTHDGLICTGWNWDLVHIKAENQPVLVGAEYTTIDGKTRINLTIPNNNYLEPTLCLEMKTEGSATIDWGDGTTPDVINYYDYYGDYKSYAIQHRWQNIDVFPHKITITISYEGNGEFFIGGQVGNTSYNIFNVNRIDQFGGKGLAYCGMVDSIICGNIQNIDLNTNSKYISAFKGLVNMKAIIVQYKNCAVNYFSNNYNINAIIIPRTCEYIYNYTFSDCSAISNVSIPFGVTTLWDNCFANCRSLNNITLPHSVTTINNTVFDGCWTLPNLFVPKSVQSIGSGVFNNCPCFNVLDMSDYKNDDNFPALSGALINGRTPLEKIYVYSEAKKQELSTMTNWAQYADKIVVKE